MKYKMPTIRLEDQAVKTLENYRWSGNIRQLRNIAEQVSVLEKNRSIDQQTLLQYLPSTGSNLPAVVKTDQSKTTADFSSEREILYKVLFDMKNDLNDLKTLTRKLISTEEPRDVREANKKLISRLYGTDAQQGADNYEEVIDQAYNQNDYSPSSPVDVQVRENERPIEPIIETKNDDSKSADYDFAEDIEEEESLSLIDKEIELIKKSLARHEGRRKAAADDLGISERTLYRKIKQYDL
jgi:transcriptional regulator with PAS, ATPase and Fis domain